MKKLLFLAVLMGIVSCKKDETKEKEGGLMSKIEAVKNSGKIAASMNDIQKNAENLRQMKPLNNNELKTAIPETLLGMKRTEITVGNMSAMNVSSADARYSDGTKSVSINVLDGAGEAGSGIISILNMSLSADMEKTTEDGFEKTISIGNSKAIVTQHINNGVASSDLKTILKNRYMVDISGDGFTVDQLKDALSEMGINRLP